MRIRWKNSGEDSENLRSYIAEGMNVCRQTFAAPNAFILKLLGCCFNLFCSNQEKST